MKIKCKKCGKIFDDETYFRICPKCGTYNSKEETPDVEQYYYGQNATVEPDHTKTYSDSSAEYSNTTGGAVKDKRRIHLLPILFLLAIASIVISVVMQKVIEQKALQRNSTLDFKVTEVTVEEPFALKESMITIHGAEVIPTDMIQGYPTGEKLIAVSYSSDGDEWHHYDQEIVAPYIFAENMYKVALNQYDFTNEYTIARLGLNKKQISYVNDYMRDQDLMYYLFSIPESAEKVVVIFEVREEDSNVSTVREKIEIPLTIEEGFANE